MDRFFAVVSAIAAASIAFAGPPGDYGDAPVGNTGAGIDAYPGVVARWPTLYNHTNTVFAPQRPQGSWLNPGATCYLGAVPPTTRNDSAMDPSLAENDCSPVILVYAIGPNPLAEVEVTVSTTASHDINRPMYLNIWIDQNSDGQWKDGYHFGTPLVAWNLEWAVQDVPVVLAPSTRARINTAGIRLENPLGSHWLRVMITDEPVGAAFRGPVGSLSHFWDGTMTAAHNFHGEIEDHLLSFQPGPPPAAVPGPGVWLREVFNPPGGGGLAKPACDVFYKGPWHVWTPRCPVPVVVPLQYRSSERNGGCSLANVLWGMYGTRHIAGVIGPPIIGVFPPPGAVLGTMGFPCPAPLVGALALPGGPIATEGPLMSSMDLPAASMTNPPGIVLTACYPPPPPVPPRLRFRTYRVFFHHYTCGSVHGSRTVFEYPETGVTVASAVVEGPGYSSDYCDFSHGDLEEAFIDLDDSRPFPDPDFTDFTFNLHEPSSGAFLDETTFVSEPSSLFLSRAGYLVTPAIPALLQADAVEFKYKGFLTVVLVGTDGQTLAATTPPTTEWQVFSLAVPADMALQSIHIDSQLRSNIDDLVIHLREPAGPPSGCDADYDQNGVADQDDVAYLINVISGGENPTERDPDFDQNGVADQDDVNALIDVIAGGDCP